MAKLKMGLYWAGSCGGCEIAVLEIHERLLELTEAAIERMMADKQTARSADAPTSRSFNSHLAEAFGVGATKLVPALANSAQCGPAFQRTPALHSTSSQDASSRPGAAPPRRLHPSARSAGSSGAVSSADRSARTAASTARTDCTGLMPQQKRRC